MRSAGWLIAAAVLASTWGATGVRAQEVALDLAACSAPARDAVRAHAALELRERLLPPGAPSDGSLRRFSVAVRCDDLRAELRVRETGAQRNVDLTTVPEPQRARLLALSIAELATDLPELRAPAPRRTAAAVATNAHRPRVAVALGVGAQLAPVWGVLGGLSVWFALRGPLRLYASAELEHARTRVDGGHVRALTTGLRLGPALAAERARVAGMFGVGVRAALHHYRGVPGRADSDARSFSSLSLGPSAFLLFQVRLRSRWLWLLESSLTHALRETRMEIRGGSARVLSPLDLGVRSGVGYTW